MKAVLFLGLAALCGCQSDHYSTTIVGPGDGGAGKLAAAGGGAGKSAMRGDSGVDVDATKSGGGSAGAEGSAGSGIAADADVALDAAMVIDGSATSDASVGNDGAVAVPCPTCAACALGGSDSDQNGYPDACDQVMWTSKELTTDFAATNFVVRFLACDTSSCGVIYSQIEKSPGPGAVDVSESDVASFAAELKTARKGGAPTVLVVRLVRPKSFSIGDSTNNPLSSGATLLRARAFGRLVSGDNAMTFEFRGH